MNHVVNYLILFSLGISGCVSFDSVTTTAKVGAKISDYTYALESENALCYYYAALEQPDYSKEKCTVVTEDTKEIRNAMLTLASYAEQLEAVATAREAKVSDQVGAALNTLNDSKFTQIDESEISGISDVSGKLFTFINDGMRRKDLKNSIVEIDSVLYLSCQSLFEYIELSIHERLLIMNMLGQKSNLSQNLAAADPNQVDLYGTTKIGRQMININTYELIFELQQDTARLKEAQKTISAFAKSHRILKEDIDKVGRGKDFEVGSSIAELVHGIYTGVNDLIIDEEK